MLKNYCKDLLVEIKGLKYQKKLVITFSKNKGNGKTEYVTVYFGSNAMTVQLVKIAKINSREFRTFCPLKKQFRKIFSCQNCQAR